MKLLYLLYKTCTKHFKSELLMMVQVFVVVILLNTSIIPFVKYSQLHYWIASKIPDEMVYYSVPTFAPLYGEDAFDYFTSLHTDTRIKSICFTYHTVGYVNGEKADVYLYSPDVFAFLNGPLESGSWNYSEEVVYINQGIHAAFDNSQEYEIIVKDNLFSIQGTFTTAGIINDHDIVFDITRAGAHPEYSEIGIDYSGIRHLTPTHTQLLAIIPFDFLKYRSSCEMIGGALIELCEGIDPEAFAQEYNLSSAGGAMFLKSDLEKNSLKRLVGTYKYDALISILVSISTLFGIGGYTYLRLDDLKKQMGIYLLCGCPPKLFSKIIIILNIILLTIPAMLAYYARNILVLSEGYDSIWSFIIALVFVCGVSAIPLTVTIYTSRKLSLTQLIYHGD